MSIPDPDFSRFEAAVSRDRLPDRLPIAEIGVDFEVMEAFLGRPIASIADLCSFWRQAGYDYVLLPVRGQPLSDSFQAKIAEGVLYREGPETASTFASPGIHDEESFEAYPWIGPQDVYYRDVDLAASSLPDGMKLVVNVGPIFSGVWRCMGLEAFSIACAEKPSLVEAVVEKTGGLIVNIVENLLERDYVGCIWLGDDLAYTQSLMASPRFFRDSIFPFYRRIGDLCRRRGRLYVFHSDGRLAEVFDDLIACGIQAIHPNEPSSVDIAALKKEWGDRLAFLGNIDVDLLSRGTPQDVADTVKRLIRNVAPGGGFALGSGNSVTKYIPLANYRAMLEAAREYGSVY